MYIYTKTCTKCNTTKSLGDFSKDCSKKDGVRPVCKSCNKAYYSENKNQILERVSTYYHDNKDRSKAYYHRNKEHIKKRRNAYQKNKIQNDSLYALRMRISSLFRCSFKDSGYSKKSKTHEILGCSYDDFKVHIENKFLEGMSWDNRSEWHLDHITPVSWGQTEEEIIALNHYTNFQPLWAIDNIKKSNRFSG